MEFVFEERKNSGRRYMDQPTPKYPAVRVTTFNDRSSKNKNARLYISFNPAAVSESRWIKGDRVVAGADLQKGVICFKRDQENGFTISGGSIGNGKAKSRSTTSMQVCVGSDSPLFALMKDHLGKWFRLSSQGLLMVALIRPSEPQETGNASDVEE
jgi:hypothetical protein